MNGLDAILTESDIPKVQELLKQVFIDTKNNPQDFEPSKANIYATQAVDKLFSDASEELHDLIISIVYSYSVGYYNCYNDMKEKENEK